MLETRTYNRMNNATMDKIIVTMQSTIAKMLEKCEYNSINNMQQCLKQKLTNTEQCKQQWLNACATSTRRKMPALPKVKSYTPNRKPQTLSSMCPAGAQGLLLPGWTWIGVQVVGGGAGLGDAPRGRAGGCPTRKCSLRTWGGAEHERE
jgi:hypothetical protein